MSVRVPVRHLLARPLLRSETLTALFPDVKSFFLPELLLLRLGGLLLPFPLPHVIISNDVIE